MSGRKPSSLLLPLSLHKQIFKNSLKQPHASQLRRP